MATARACTGNDHGAPATDTSDAIVALPEERRDALEEPAHGIALDGGTGEVAWQRKLDGPVWGRISVANGVGFAGVGGKLEGFDVDSGAHIKAILGKRGTVAGTISIANGRVAYGEGMSWATAKPGSTLTVLSIE